MRDRAVPERLFACALASAVNTTRECPHTAHGPGGKCMVEYVPLAMLRNSEEIISELLDESGVLRDRLEDIESAI